MTPDEHYVEAERLLDQAAKDAARMAGMVFNSANPTHVEQLRANNAIHANTIAMALAHATLATVRLDPGAPVIVTAPTELIEKIRVVDPGPSNRGILFIPDELQTSDERPLEEGLIEAMTRPLGDRG